MGLRSLLTLGGASAFALVLGQYPYLYLTVAFIQMLKARGHISSNPDPGTLALTLAP